jgi:hypothetical protein
MEEEDQNEPVKEQSIPWQERINNRKARRAKRIKERPKQGAV